MILNNLIFWRIVVNSKRENFCLIFQGLLTIEGQKDQKDQKDRE